MNRSFVIRLVAGTLASLGLVIVFVFQQVNIAAIFQLSDKAINQFVINRLVRFFINDALTIVLIYALFGERKYVMFAIWVQVIGMMVFLVPYLVIKAYFPHYNGPLINFIHRLILNPTLLLLLIPAFLLQKRRRVESQ